MDEMKKSMEFAIEIATACSIEILAWLLGFGG